MTNKEFDDLVLEAARRREIFATRTAAVWLRVDYKSYVRSIRRLRSKKLLYTSSPSRPDYRGASFAGYRATEEVK